MERIYKRVIRHKFDSSDKDARVAMQLVIYLIQSTVVDFGYSFQLKNGLPYSEKLEEDIDKTIKPIFKYDTEIRAVIKIVRRAICVCRYDGYYWLWWLKALAIGVYVYYTELKVKGKGEFFREIQLNELFTLKFRRKRDRLMVYYQVKKICKENLLEEIKRNKKKYLAKKRWRNNNDEDNRENSH